MTAHAAYFSPTQTSAEVVKSILKGAAYPQRGAIDLTFESTPMEFTNDDLLVIGMPVYGGRLPAVAVERFRQLKGNNTPAIAVVIYGNRAYDDALIELCDLCVEQGFSVAASAAFIGEHSFSTTEQPIAEHRPDRADLEKAEAFGRASAGRLEKAGRSTAAIPAGTPGNRPYKPAMNPSAAAAESNEKCTNCGICEKHCPTHAITGTVTDPTKCIWCAACVKACPIGARQITLEKVQLTAKKLYDNCQTRIEPEWYVN